MVLQLDIKTILISLVIGHLFTVILISAYWKNFKKDSTFNTFFLSKCCQAMAWFFLTLRDGIPDLFTISLANSLLFLGCSLECIAVLKLLQAFHRITKRIYSLLTIFTIIGFHLTLLFYNVESIRIAYASFGTAIFVIYPAYQTLRRTTSSLLMKMMGLLYLLVAISFTGRGISSLLSNQTLGLFTPSIYQTLSFLTLFLVMIMGNTGFVLLLKESVDKELIRMASIDDLTGILNRRTFILHTKNCLFHCAREKKPVSLILLDVDHFKEINDTYGHDVGDRVLRHLTEKIHQHLHQEDLFGRYGGDEFAILLPGKNEVESAQIAEWIRQITDQERNQELPVQYTLSLGLLTVIPDQHTQWDSLYIACDKALYGAKNKGRNQVFQDKYVG